MQERENNRIVTEALLIQLAAKSAISNKAGKEFSKAIKALNVQTSLHEGQFEEG